MAGSTAGTKRPHSSLDDIPHKKRKVHHQIRHEYKRPEHIEPAPQDPVFSQGQLLRSLSAALAMVGFDSVKPTALEMFRAATEQYMLQFLRYARTSMQGARRTRPTVQDFTSALALMPNSASASHLKPQLSLHVPPDLSNPPIPEPDEPLRPAPDFGTLLAPLVSSEAPAYIPKHFPQLPPRHAWVTTSVYPEREVDARKMREMATEEGLMAEQALRKLAAAAKAGAVKVERRREAALSGVGKLRGSEQGGEKGVVRRKREDGEQMFANILQEVGARTGEALELGIEGVDSLREEGVDLDMPDGVVVNYDMAGWRRSGRTRLRL